MQGSAKKVVPGLRELAPRGKRESRSGIHATYRVIQGSWLKGGTLYIWYRWTYPEILLGGGSHKLFFLFGVS